MIPRSIHHTYPLLMMKKVVNHHTIVVCMHKPQLQSRGRKLSPMLVPRGSRSGSVNSLPNSICRSVGMSPLNIVSDPGARLSYANVFLYESIIFRFCRWFVESFVELYSKIDSCKIMNVFCVVGAFSIWLCI